MHTPLLRRTAYRLSAVLGGAYGAYVVVLKLLHRPSGGPLGDLGEFLLVLACVTSFAVGLFADEAARQDRAAHPHAPPHPHP